MCMSFRTSLADLVERLNACAPHFIRCIKPNDLQRKSLWDEALVKRQLQYSGVLETIKIRKVICKGNSFVTLQLLQCAN